MLLERSIDLLIKKNLVPREYVENMNYVDEKIKEAVNLTEHFFGKGTTAYVFTADHGMTDWGSHGSGLPFETETPFVAWGAGIKSSGFRRDIEQASIAPLIASLIGIPVPINNEVRSISVFISL